MVSGRRAVQFSAQRPVQQPGKYQTSGELAYHFLLDIDFAQLDSLKLESELKEKEFRDCRIWRYPTVQDVRRVCLHSI